VQLTARILFLLLFAPTTLTYLLEGTGVCFRQKFFDCN